MFKPIGSLIGAVSNKTKARDAIVALSVRQRAGEVILKSCSDLPSELTSKIKVVSFKNGVLNLKAPGLLRVELLVRAEGLRKDINTASGGFLIKQIRVRN